MKTCYARHSFHLILTEDMAFKIKKLNNWDLFLSKESASIVGRKFVLS